MPSLNVGDLVIGNGRRTYSVTDETRVCVVLRDFGWDDICVLVLSNDNHYGESFAVSKEGFTRIDTTHPRWGDVHPDIRGFNGDHIDPNDIIIDGISVAENNRRFGNHGKHGESLTFLCCGTPVPSPVLFNKEKTYAASDDSINLSIKALKSVLDRYEVAEGVNYDYNDEYVEEVVRKNAKAKQWWDACASKLPNWNADYRYLDDRITLKRETSHDGKQDFVNFLWQAFVDVVLYSKKVPELDTSKYYDIKDEYKKYCRISEGMTYTNVENDMKYMDLTYSDVVNKRDELYASYRELENYRDLPSYTTSDGKKFRCNSEVKRLMNKLQSIMNEIMNTNERLTEANAEKFNSLEPELKARADQKLSTIVLKLGQMYSLTEWTGKTQTISWVDTATGETMSKEKVDNWNGRYTKFCDAIKPLKKDFRCIITSNISDFVTMSNGSSWASCMTLDKTNLDERSGNYEGCYSGGTIDYACDPSTIMMYLIPEDNTDEATWDVPKQKRCLFYVGESDFVQSRVYPDGRDGSEFPNIRKELLDKFIEVVTKMSETDLPSDQWTSGKYSDYTNIDRHSDSLHYADYHHYDDLTTVRNRVITRFKRIKVGATVPCLCCGRTNENENAVICANCCEKLDDNMVTCEECDERFDLDDDYSVIGFDNYGGEHYFCCRECAEQAGYRYCEDEDEYRDDWYQDDYDDRYYHDDSEKEVTRDGHVYSCRDHAESDGYVFCDDINDWLKEDEARYCENCNSWVSADNYDEEKEMCKDCLSEESEGE